MNLTKEQINIVLYLLSETIRVHKNDYVNQERIMRIARNLTTMSVWVKKCEEIEKKLKEGLND